MKHLLLLIKFCVLTFALVASTTFVVQAQGWEKELPVLNYIHSTLLPNDEVMLLSRSSNTSNAYTLSRVDASGGLVSQADIATDYLLNEVHYTADGGLLLVGRDLIHTLYLIKTNVDGSTVEWEKLFDNDADSPFRGSSAFHAFPVSDGSWLIFDDTQQKIGDDWFIDPSLALIRVDELGNTIWQETYQSNPSDSLFLSGLSILEKENGGFILAGIGQRSRFEDYPFLKHIGDDGVETATYYGDVFIKDAINTRMPYFATQTADGNFLFTKSNMLLNNFETPLIKVSPTAELIWETGIMTFLGFGEARPSQIVALEDGGFVIPYKYGLCNDYGVEPYCWYNYNIIKYNEAGEQVWSTASAGVAINVNQSEDLHAFELSDHGILAVGRASLANEQEEDQTLYTYLFRLTTDGTKLGNQLVGNVFIDQNQNCVFDEGEYSLSQQLISLTSTDSNPYRTISLPDGTYSVRVAPGTYAIELENLSDYYALDCYVDPQDLQVTFTEDYATQSFDIVLHPLVECPALEVEVGVGEIAPCEVSTYRVQYCNMGTTVAQAAYITLQLDQHQLISDSNTPYTDLGNQLFRFDLEEVAPGTCSSFNVMIALSCEVAVGLTHCVEAQIYPQESCLPPNPDWDGSFIEVNATCDSENGEVIFTIQNTGTSNMSQPRYYEVYEDHVMLEMNNFQLNAGASMEIKRPANGTTMRLEAEQSAGAFSISVPMVFVEACGLNEEGTVSTEIVTSVSDGDFDDFLDISCVVSTASFDPNDKAVTPSGVTPEHHFVNVTDQLNYKIRFQNTGTDTAELVIIRDTISQYLDISTFNSGISSHDYTVHFIDTNVIEFHFDPIELPDSNVNEPASNGFVEFSIYPYPTTPLRTRIENTAAIYFDRNAPVITNTTFNTIGERFYTVNIASGSEITMESLQIEIAPNPVQGQAVMTLKGIEDLNDFSLVIYDMHGRSIKKYQNRGSSNIIIEAQDLLPGMYFYRLIKEKQTVNTGKLLFE